MTAKVRTIRRRARAPRERRFRIWIWPSLAIALSLVLWLPFLDLPMISDEGGYAYVTSRWLAGEGHLYHDLWVSRPQGIFAVYALILETLGDDVVAFRLGAWIAAAATLILVWRMARAWAGTTVASVAVFLFALLCGSPAFEGFTANAEVFMALPAAGAVWLLWRAATTGWRRWPLVAAGVSIGLATLLKPSGIVVIGVGLALIWLLESRNRTLLQRAGWLIAGFGLALLPALAHGWWIGWDAYLYAAVTYRPTSQSSATAGLDHQLLALMALLMRCWPLLVMTALVLGIARGRAWRFSTWHDAVQRELARAGRVGIVARVAVMRGQADTAPLLLRLWLLASFAGVAMGGDWWPHYLIQALAPFSLWLAPYLVAAWSRLAGWRRWGLAATIVVAVLSPYSVLARGDDASISRAIFGQDRYPDQAVIADYLRQHAPEDASIFVGFDNPAIYYLADRRAAYRYMYDAELQAIPGSYGALVDLIESSDRPRYIVGTKERAPYPDRGQAFWDAVIRHYHIVDHIRGIPILREDDGLGRGR
ncbi:MAG: glycosyltransferase family 39 protein [Chloroflexota bacterium]|nr:glycosyltransferase family 39 protein [Chloroflexota bacterium]